MASSIALEDRMEAEFAAARAQIRQFQTQAERSYEETHQRFRKLLDVSHRIRKLIQPRLEILAHKFEFEAKPTIFHSRQHYHSTVTCAFHSELARISLRFALGHDSEIRTLFLEQDLEILPIYIKFPAHARLEIPLEEFDEAATGRWLDDRLVDFIRTFIQIQFTEQYQRDHMVTDPIANVRFPKSFAKMTLQHRGQTYYFISDETCWEFERREGVGAV